MRILILIHRNAHGHPGNWIVETAQGILASLEAGDGDLALHVEAPAVETLVPGALLSILASYRPTLVITSGHELVPVLVEAINQQRAHSNGQALAGGDYQRCSWWFIHCDGVHYAEVDHNHFDAFWPEALLTQELLEAALIAELAWQESSLAVEVEA